MTQENFTTVILKADEGMFLTQKGEPERRSIAGTVYLGRGDSPDNWVEITAEEAERYKAEEGQAE